MIDMKKALFNQGKNDALDLQNNSSKMTNEELYQNIDSIPDFSKVKNFNKKSINFICLSSEGRIVKLIKPYDNAFLPGEPEQISQNWDFIWSTNPKNALPFIETDHSPYNIGECCTVNGKIYRSTEDSNTKIPVINLAIEGDNSGLTLSPGWEKVE